MKEVVLEAGGLVRGSSAPALETFLRRHPGVHHAEASYMSDTVTVGYDETVISEAEIRGLIEECGYHCRGEVLPRHICAPEPGTDVEHRPPALAGEHAGHAGHEMHAMPAESTAVSGEVVQMAADKEHPSEMGHGAGMSMEGMVRDIRNRFLLTFLLAIPVFLYSPLATEVFNLRLPLPFGIPADLLLFILSTPAVLWGGQMFFVGAYRALKNRILDMSVLVALSVGAGYL
ncbi:MAG TPA: cation transporter, partial [Anaerolineales bacterium]